MIARRSIISSVEPGSGRFPNPSAHMVLALVM